MPTTSPRQFPTSLDRRLWLTLGGLSFGAFATGLQPTLGNLLAAEAGKTAVDKDFSVILFWANGGPSHLDLFDLKPQAPAEYRGPFQPIATSVDGLQVSELLPVAIEELPLLSSVSATTRMV